MRVSGGDEPAFGLRQEQLAMARGHGKPALGIEIELARALKHPDSPRKNTTTHFLPPFPTLYAENRAVKRGLEFLPMVTKVYGDFRAPGRRNNNCWLFKYLEGEGKVARGPPGQGRDKCHNRRGKPADKPGSVADSHSSWHAVTRVLQRPTRGQREPRCRPLRGLAPDGVYPAVRVATDAVRSYRTFSPLPAPRGLRRCIFCGTFRRLAAPGR
jgi:hypothetical protein